MNASLLVVTRIHMQVSSSKPEVGKMVEFVRRASAYAQCILICHDVKPLMMEYLDELKSKLHELNLSSIVQYLSVDPWGYFTYSLNAALQFAQDNLFSLIAFQSVEFAINATRVSALTSMISSDSSILVVGPEMDGHCFSTSDSPISLRGRTCPWNTFAIWNVSKLCVTGFPMIGDGVAGNRKIGGVEEVSAISILQLINPSQHLAYLVRFTDENSSDISTTTWSTSFNMDSERQAYHDRKMASKDERPAEQMRISCIPAGVVRHTVVAL